MKLIATLLLLSLTPYLRGPNFKPSQSSPTPAAGRRANGEYDEVVWKPLEETLVRAMKKYGDRGTASIRRAH